MSKRIAAIILALISTFALSISLRPTISSSAESPHLATQIPTAFGQWKEIPNPLDQISASTDELSREQPYDEVLARSYTNGAGAIVMLTLAYGKNQRQEIKIHRPELCYPAQGFAVKDLKDAHFSGITSSTTGETISGKRMIASHKMFSEAVSYWIRIGDTYSSSAWQTRWTIMKEGLNGRMTDGILVRVSQRIPPGSDPTPHYELQEEFARELVNSLNGNARTVLAR